MELPERVRSWEEDARHRNSLGRHREETGSVGWKIGNTVLQNVDLYKCINLSYKNKLRTSLSGG